jgi:hypothetical protein
LAILRLDKAALEDLKLGTPTDKLAIFQKWYVYDLL